MVPTVRLGTNLRHALSARRSDDVRCDSAFLLLVKATDLGFLQVRFFVGRSMRERRALSTPFSREVVDTVGAQDALEALGDARLKSEKIRYILPKLGKESVDLPDFVKDSVAILQILLTF